MIVNLFIPELFRSLERAILRDELQRGAASALWDFVDLLQLLLGQAPIEDIQVLSHPLLVVTLDNHTHSLLEYPPQRNLQDKFHNKRSLCIIDNWILFTGRTSVSQADNVVRT